MRPTRLSNSAVLRESRSGARNHRGCLGLLDSDTLLLDRTKGGILTATPHDSENSDVQVTKTNSESLGTQTVNNHIILALEHTSTPTRVSRKKQSGIDQIRSQSCSGCSSSSAAAAIRNRSRSPLQVEFGACNCLQARNPGSPAERPGLRPSHPAHAPAVMLVGVSFSDHQHIKSKRCPGQALVAAV
jgi:hypothetical protein